MKKIKYTTDSYPNWFDKNKFKKFLAIIDGNKFNFRHKTGECKYIDIKDLVNNIKNNAINEKTAKKDLNTLNQIKNVEIIKQKRHTPKLKELLNLFNNLSDTILTGKTLESESQEVNTLLSSKDENENETINENVNVHENVNENVNGND